MPVLNDRKELSATKANITLVPQSELDSLTSSFKTLDLQPESEPLTPKQKLEAAIESYMNLSNSELVNESDSSSNNTSKPDTIKALLDRFLTEDFSQYGSSQELIATIITPILDAFTRNPNHLRIADEIAKLYLDGCVEKLVAGWLEISAITSIAQAETIFDKIEASKHLRALEKVTSYVATLPQDQKPGEKVEFEARNFLFIEVHKKLIENRVIENSWLAVPNSITYKRMIRDWLTEGLINQAYQQVTEVLAQNPQEASEYLCEGNHRKIWAQVAFLEETNQIKGVYAERMEISKLAASEEEIAKLLAKEIYETDDSPKALKKIQNLHKKLTKKMDEEIIAEVKELTFRALAEASSNYQKMEVDNSQLECSSNHFQTYPAEKNPVSKFSETTSCSPLSGQKRKIENSCAPETVEATSCLKLNKNENSKPFSRG